MDFLGIGPGELVLILIIALMVFGPGKLPEIARGLGKAVHEFRKYSSALTKDFKEEFEKEVRASPEEESGSPRRARKRRSKRKAALAKEKGES